MKRFDNRLIWGVLLIVGGGLFLLENLGLFAVGDFVWAILMVIVGIGFLSVVVTNPQRWWAIIPGMILTYLALLIILSSLAPAFANNYGGPLLLAVIGLSFILIYLLNTTFWWAIIPAGVMVTLAIVAATERFINGIETGGIFFIGLGLTFGLLSLIHTPTGQMRWPLIPGLILVVIGAIISFSATSMFRLFWPIALILAGLYLFLARIPPRR